MLNAPSLVQSLTIDPGTTPGIVYAGGTFSYRSVDGGTTWDPLQIGYLAFAVAIDPVTPTTIYAGTSVGVFTSTDSGTTWTQMSLGGGLADARSLIVDPGTPSTIYAGLEDHGGAFYGFYVSADTGGAWSAENTGLTSRRVYALAIAAGSPRTLYAATPTGPFQMQLVCNHDGVVDPGEQCDELTYGAPLSCCSVMCNIRAGGDCPDEGEFCTRDVCDAAGACTHPVAPLPPGRCSVPVKPGGASLTLRVPRPGETRAAFKWAKGQAPRSPLPDPGASGVGLCVYEQTGPGTYAIALSGFPSVVDGGTWMGTGTTGWNFTSAAGAPDGITSVKIKGLDKPYRDDSTKGKVQVTANGNPAFPLGLPLNPGLVAQFKYSSGIPLCWEATFPSATTNTATRFKATSP